MFLRFFEYIGFCFDRECAFTEQIFKSAETSQIKRGTRAPDKLQYLWAQLLLRIHGCIIGHTFGAPTCIFVVGTAAQKRRGRSRETPAIVIGRQGA